MQYNSQPHALITQIQNSPTKGRRGKVIISKNKKRGFVLGDFKPRYLKFGTQDSTISLQGFNEDLSMFEIFYMHLKLL